ncbi:MAG: hypothetical protein IT436_17190 [Phycisphaerales bacterium]|nr:hypothetical protein [Phycisphaerales bacterium]
MKRAFLLMAAASILAPAALAQTPLPLTNRSFEDIDPFNPVEPTGWHNISNPVGALHRFAGDGLTPAVTPRTGNACIELKALRPGAPGMGGFIGFTTDKLNFFLPGLPYYDPEFVWQGGDVVVSGYYMIPTSEPITGDVVAFKLSCKLPGPQDAAVYDTFALGPTISGTTNGEWRYYEVRWTDAQITAAVLDGQAQGYFTMPPYPNHLKIVIGRYAPDGTPTSGTIFWDDVDFAQVPAGCAADLNGDGIVDFADYLEFLNFYDAQDPRADFNMDGIVDFADYLEFLNHYDAGC